MIAPKDWQKNAHTLHQLPMNGAKEMLSHLMELDAELQGAIRTCRTRISALKDIENAELRVTIAQLTNP